MGTKIETSVNKEQIGQLEESRVEVPGVEPEGFYGGVSGFRFHVSLDAFPRLDPDIQEVAGDNFRQIENMYHYMEVAAFQIEGNGVSLNHKVEIQEDEDGVHVLFGIYSQDEFYEKLVQDRAETLQHEIEMERIDKRNRKLWNKAKLRLVQYLKHKQAERIEMEQAKKRAG